MCKLSAAIPRKKVAVEANKTHMIPYIEVANPYKFDGTVLLIIDNEFAGETSPDKAIK